MVFLDCKIHIYIYIHILCFFFNYGSLGVEGRKGRKTAPSQSQIELASVGEKMRATAVSVFCF